MSEIAGRLAAQAGAYFLEKPLGGRGLLLGGVAGVAPGKVVVIGGGMVGYNAAVIALGLGANVTILERSVDRMRHLEEILSGRVSLLMSSSLQIEESVAEADVVIGAVLIPGAVAPKLITRAMVAEMKDGSVLCDVAIDQGADERDPALRRGDRRPRPPRSRRPRPRAGPWRQRPRGKDHLRGGRRGPRPRLLAARRRPTAGSRLTSTRTPALNWVGRRPPPTKTTISPKSAPVGASGEPIS